MTRHTMPWKEQQLTDLKNLIETSPVIAVADLTMFPASLFAKIRKQLQGKATIRVSKTRVIKKALSQTSLKDSKILDQVKNEVGVIFTDMNPFELFGFLKKNKGSVFAKEGMTAPKDIVIPAGDTGLPPGPALSDLKNAGLKVKVGGATIVIQEDKIVTKAGEQITAPIAGTLSKLNIKPIRIGLNLKAALEKGQIFLPNVLDIDEELVFNNFKLAHSQAFNLASNITYITPQTIKLFLAKAGMESKNLAVEISFPTKETIEILLAKANAQANALKLKIKTE